VWLLAAGIPAANPAEPKLARFEFDRVEMAVPIRILLYANDPEAANGGAQAALDRIHALNAVFSDYEPTSEMRRLWATAGEGKAVPVSDDLWQVLTRAYELSERSEGAFDVTIGPMIRIWRRARDLHELPSPQKIEQARQLVGYRLMRLDAQCRAVELTKAGMRLDLGGIAKGYAAEEALAVLRKQGLSRAMVHAGGDISLGDPPPDKPGWIVGIAPPQSGARPIFYLSLSRSSIATSGDTMQYTMIEGRRYSHIVDPKTGIGLTDHSSVSVVAPDGATADALATAVAVLGPEKGLKLVDSTPGAAAYILRGPEGKLQHFQSSRWKDLPTVSPGAAAKKQISEAGTGR